MRLIIVSLNYALVAFMFLMAWVCFSYSSIVGLLIFLLGGILCIPGVSEGSDKKSARTIFQESLAVTFVFTIVGLFPVAYAIGTSAEAVYLYAEDLEQEGDKVAALAKYEEVVATDPEYKDAEEKVAELKSEINEEQKQAKQAELKQKYQAGFNQEGQGNKAEALTRYKAAAAIDPEYKDVQSRIERLEKHFAAEEKKAREKAQREKEAAEKRENEKWNTALTAYQTSMADLNFVEGIEYRHNTIHSDRKEAWIVIQVRSVWHYQPKAIRLQAAQNFWKVWSMMALANKLVKDLDMARIKVVDMNGNEVGGSRVWGGSLIWVDD